MMIDPLLSLVGIFVLGIAAQWLAWRVRLPSILLLLTFGFIAGPITGLLDVDALFGDLLFPFVELAVAIILFEGGLSLRFDDIRPTGRVIRNLITVGALVSLVLTSVAAVVILGLNVALAVQLGAVLVVTGPTVIGPLLRHVRPSSNVDSILRWEGILIDPVGATLAVLVFDAILIGDVERALVPTLAAVVVVAVTGTAIGWIGGMILVQLLRRYLIPDYLQSAVTLMAVVAFFALSETIQHESGLLATTVMGIVMVNQRSVNLRRIVEFKENIGVLLVSVLFILLAARLRLSDLMALGGGTVLFIAVLLFVVRPAAVLVSTYRSPLTFNERLFLSWMAPRGIVAAAVASVFALRLEAANMPQAELLVPLTFAVIVATCAIYGLTALPLARRLGLSQANPQGVLIIGAHALARAIAKAIQDLDHPVVLIDTNWHNVAAARMMGLDAHYGSAVSEESENIVLEAIGRALALTSNMEVNALAAMHYRDQFGGKEIYQLPFQTRQPTSANGGTGPVSRGLRGRLLFRDDASFDMLNDWFASGGVIKATPLTSAFGYQAYLAEYGGRALPMFVHDPAALLLTVVAADTPVQPQAGQTIVSLVRAAEDAPVGQAVS